MKRVAIIGPPGTGKPTFAKKLAERTQLPLIHLDYYYHDKSKNYYEDTDSWRKLVTQLATQKTWIIDGNYLLKERIEHADTIVYFNLPTHAALRGVVQRRMKARCSKRTDMPEDWQETLNWEFTKYVWGYRKKYASAIEKMLSLNKDRQVIIFKTRPEADLYLKNL